MMGPGDYGVRVIRPYAQFSVGRVIYPSALLREKLVQQKWVEPVAPPPGIAEQAVDAVKRAVGGKRK